MSFDQLKRMFLADRIGRRDFLMGATAIGAAAAASTVISGRAAAAGPKSGGHARIGLGAGSTSDSLDPATILDTYMQTTNYGLRNNLTEIAPSGELVPELAESWEASEDAATWTFKLRKGIEFHNGKTMTAEDVIASINHHRGEESKSAVKSLLETVKEIRADGTDTVVIELASGSADFPYLMNDYHLVICPAKDGGIDWQSGIGTGGYVMKDFEPGVRMSMERNPNYWKEGRAHFDSAEALAILDVAARTNALTAGEIDVMNRCDLKTVHLLQRSPNVDIWEVTGTQHYTFPMITTEKPFDDPDVRMALKLAVDREDMVQKILRGHGAMGNDNPIPPATTFHANLPQRPYDPEKAKFHLKKAGAEGLTVDLSGAEAAFAGAVDACVLYKEHAAKAGITINVVREPNDGYWSNVWMKKPWSACYWGGRPTADWMFTTAYAADAAWNDTFWNNERFNKLLVEARTELDEAKRAAMYKEMQELVRDDGGVVLPMLANYVGAASKKMGHDKIAANWDMDGLKLIERWWFA